MSSTTAPDAAEPPRLRIIGGSQVGRAVKCTQPRMVIGRGSTADVMLVDDGASRAHACVSWSGQDWRVEDLGSRNGTRLNGATIQGTAPLHSGDRIRVGTTELAFEGGEPEPAPDPVAGCSLGERLGMGSLAEAWRAETANGEPRVVKRLLAELTTDAEAVAGFLAGARAQERLAHPQVVPVFHTARTPHPTVVMGWAAGGSLAAKLAKGKPLQPDAALTLARQAATALQAACGMGLPHPNLHPGNVLFDAEGTVLISDWALPPTSRRGATAPWLAPEEVGGAPADALVDQCRLGLILWQCLAVNPPFVNASTTIEPASVARARLTGRIDMPAAVPGQPDGLARLIARMVARDPRHRFSDWTDLREAIDIVADGKVLPPLYEESLLRLPGGETARIRRKASAPPAPASESRALAVQVKSTERIHEGRPSSRTSTRGIERRKRVPGSTVGALVLLVVAVVAVLIGTKLFRNSTEPLGEHRAGPSSHPAARDDQVRTGPGPAPGTHSGDERDTSLIKTAASPDAPSTVAIKVGQGHGADPMPAPVSGPRASGAAPPLHPSVVLASWVGGTGNQCITSIAFTADGRITAMGAGFSAQIDVLAGTAFIHGEPDTDTSTAKSRPRLAVIHPELPLAIDGEQLKAGTRDADGVQLPTISGPNWSWWDISGADAARAGLACDTVLMGAYARADGEFVLAGRADAANTCFARDPRQLDRQLPALRDAPRRGSTWAFLGNPKSGELLGARSCACDALAAACDPWGRLYLAAPTAGKDDLGMGGDAGLTVLSPDLADVLLDVRLGGKQPSEAGWEGFTCAAYRDGLLALGGSTCAAKLATVDPMQNAPGGSQDGLVVVIRLWDAEQR